MKGAVALSRQRRRWVRLARLQLAAPQKKPARSKRTRARGEGCGASALGVRIRTAQTDQTRIARDCSRQNKTAAEFAPTASAPISTAMKLCHHHHHRRRIRGDRGNPAIKCWRVRTIVRPMVIAIFGPGLDPRYVDRLLAIRRPGERYSDVIPRAGRRANGQKKPRARMKASARQEAHLGWGQ